MVAADYDGILFGEDIPRTATQSAQQQSLHDESADIIERWFAFREDWLEVARTQKLHHVTQEQLARALCVRSSDGRQCWDIVELYKHIDICRWFLDSGQIKFPSIAVLARVWLARSTSTAFQERVFSSGSCVMSPLRSRLDNDFGEKLLLLCHNKHEIKRMKEDTAAPLVSS
jgi:hypothetical protein